MKKYTIGLITGALLGISVMMFMGASREPVGRYQPGTVGIVIDTVTGDAYTWNIKGAYELKAEMKK